ncbi:MAG: dihydroorotase [Eubacteriales bacterium]|nr:dihydroorotase [Eubacteriales bacterium]
MTTLIKNGRVIDPASKTDEVRDILVENGIIKSVEKNIDAAADHVIDAEGYMVMPGLIDLHVHFREPGFEHKETIRTGARAAARGGFTTVCCMPNTKPVIDSVDMIKMVIDKAKEVTDINVLPIAAITAGQDGEYITDFEKLKENGAIAVSEDGKSVMNARVARQAMRLAAQVGIPVFAHCEDKNLVARGVMNAGEKAKELGFYGIMNAVEDVIVARDILLAKNTGAQLHLCHCSTQDSVRMVKLAKEEGLNVTAEVAPHHFTLTEDDIHSDDANFKMNPPLRSRADVETLKGGLKDDVMDVIATDHAPHHKTEKERSFTEAPFGITGLETSVSLTMTELVKTGILTPMQMAEKMSYNPAKIIGIDKGTLLPGKTADITIIDPEAEYVINSDRFASMGKNTPFNGRKVYGQVRYTIVNGRVVYSNKNGSECIIDKDVPKV